MPRATLVPKRCTVVIIDRPIARSVSQSHPVLRLNFGAAFSLPWVMLVRTCRWPRTRACLPHRSTLPTVRDLELVWGIFSCAKRPMNCHARASSVYGDTSHSRRSRLVLLVVTPIVTPVYAKVAGSSAQFHTSIRSKTSFAQPRAETNPVKPAVGPRILLATETMVKHLGPFRRYGRRSYGHKADHRTCAASQARGGHRSHRNDR
jgi:hypothetical protein